MASPLFLAYAILLLSFHFILTFISTISILAISILSSLAGCQARSADLFGRLIGFTTRRIRSVRLELARRPHLVFRHASVCHYTPGQLLMRAYRELLCTTILVIFTGLALIISKIIPDPVIEYTAAATRFLLSFYHCTLAIGSILIHIKASVSSATLSFLSWIECTFYTTCIFSSVFSIIGRATLWFSVFKHACIYSFGRIIHWFSALDKACIYLFEYSRSYRALFRRFISHTFPLISELRRAYIRLIQILSQEICAAQSLLDPFGHQNFIFWKKEGLSSIRRPSKSLIHFIDIIKGLKGLSSPQIVEKLERMQFEKIISEHKALYNNREEGSSAQHGNIKNRKCKHRKMNKKHY